jgi:hypothetical protein
MMTVALLTFTTPLHATRQTSAPPTQPEAPLIRNVRIEGVSVYTVNDLQRRMGLAPGVRLPGPPAAIVEDIEDRYERDGYSFARAEALFDEAGTLTITVDEGHVDEIEFRGVSAEVAARLREAFAIPIGDVFNRGPASRALDEALALTQGAVERSPGQTFRMDRDQGRRVLLVFLQTRSRRSGVFVGSQGREDWYSPVDGFAPAVGFQSTISDSTRFNHSYWAGYVSYKVAAERVGYTFGFERPFFAGGVLQAGASVHDVTGSDDQWRLLSSEQSLVAFGFRNTFRDYYRRQGFQLHAALRPFARHELLVAWRGESHDALVNETDFGLFRDRHPFRPNQPMQAGDLHALLVGYTFDSRGLTEQAPGERYRRHLLDDLFGSLTDDDHGARVEWRSELAPSAFDGDFDFSRHIVTARTWWQMTPRRTFSGRLIAGVSDGMLPPQRIFALGGIGSVHGYGFKEAAGGRMVLLNAELRQRVWRGGLAALAFLDAGRVGRPLPGSTTGWLTGAGVGVEAGPARLEFGWRVDDIPQSLQVLFRLNRSF